jgi:hypothetical protein
MSLRAQKPRTKPGPKPSRQSHRVRPDKDLEAIVTVRYTIKNLGSLNEIRSYGFTFEEMVRNCIRDEGLIGIAEDDYEVLFIEPREATETQTKKDKP